MGVSYMLPETARFLRVPRPGGVTRAGPEGLLFRRTSEWEIDRRAKLLAALACRRYVGTSAVLHTL